MLIIGKKTVVLLVSIVLMSLFSGNVFGQESGSLESALEVIADLFGFLPELLTMEKLLAGDPMAVFWAKFLLWLGLFAAIYFGTSIIFKQNNRVAVIIAIAVSLIGALMIPTSLVASIMQTYGFVSALVIWAVPVLVGFYLASKVESRLIRAFIYLIALAVLTAINTAIVTKDIFSVSFPYFGLIWIAVFFMFIWNLIAGARGTGGAPTTTGGGGWLQNFMGGADEGARMVGGDLGSGGRSIWNRFFGRGGRADIRPMEGLTDEAGRELTREERITRLNTNLDMHINKLKKDIIGKEEKEIEHLNEIVKIIDYIRGIINELDGLTRQIRNREINAVKIKYNQLVDDLMKELRKLANVLREERLERKVIEKLYGRELYNTRKAEFDRLNKDFKRRMAVIEHKLGGGVLIDQHNNPLSVLRHSGKIDWKPILDRIKELDDNFEHLLMEDIRIEEGNLVSINKIEGEVDLEFEVVNGLIIYLEENVQASHYRVFKINVRRKVPEGTISLTPSILEQIRERVYNVYQQLVRRGNEEQRRDKYYTPLKNKIEIETRKLLDSMEAQMSALEGQERKAEEIITKEQRIRAGGDLPPDNNAN
jgi:hypothetical protein